MCLAVADDVGRARLSALLKSCKPSWADAHFMSDNIRSRIIILASKLREQKLPGESFVGGEGRSTRGKWKDAIPLKAEPGTWHAATGLIGHPYLRKSAPPNGRSRREQAETCNGGV